MPRTWGQIRSELVKAFPGVDLTLVNGWIIDAYDEILAHREWSGLETTGFVTVAGAYREGSINVTAGSTTVTGTSTVWDVAMTGRKLRALERNEWYTIAIDGPTALTLDRPWEGATETILPYSIYSNTFLLPLTVRTLDRLLNSTADRQMEPIAGADLDLASPNRLGLGTASYYSAGPYELVYTSNPPTAYKRVEIYPAPEYATTFQFFATSAVGTFTGTNTSDSPAAWVSDALILALARSKAYDHVKDRAGEQAAIAAYNRQLQALDAVENSRTGGQRLKMASRFTRHRLYRSFR
jgi:hypothetical protein